MKIKSVSTNYTIESYIKIIGIFLFCILLSGCNSKMKFEKSQNEFNTTYKNEHIEVQIANNVENSEEVFASIERDLNIINHFKPIEKLDIHINEKFLKGNDKSGVECNGEFVKTPQFKQLLIANAYDLYDNWKAVGIYGNLFADEMDANFVSTNANDKATEQNQGEVDFVSYYQNHNFSLFGAHFFPDFSSGEEIKNLSYASTSLVKYFLDNGKKEKLLKEEISIEDIKPWAEQNHINLTYLEELYNHINEIKVSSPSAIDKLHIETKRDIHGFSIRIASMDKQYDSATKLEKIIKTFDEDIIENLRLIREKAPNFYKDYEKQLTQTPKIRYYFNPKEISNMNNFTTGDTVIINVESQLHEYNHFLMKRSFEKNGVLISKPMWVTEGVDPYLDFMYLKKSLLYDKKSIQFSLDDTKVDKLLRDGDKETYKYCRILQKMMRLNFSEEELNNLDLTLNNPEHWKKYFHIKNAMALGYRELFKSDRYYSDTVAILGRAKQSYTGMKEPDAQNYFANRSFVAYLIETYGYEKMLYFSVQDFTKITFEEYFGKSYKELDADWKQYLIDNIKGGELLVYGEEGQK